MAREDRDRWDARWASAEAADHAAPAWLGELDAELPRAGDAIDVAAGSGRIARWAARRGLDVTAIDVSPVGLAIARAAAEAEGLVIATVELDLEHAPLPAGPYALVSAFHYRQPSLWPELRARLAPGGVLLAELLTRRNLERHPHPSGRWLAAPNELLRCAEGLEIVFYREGWQDDRHVSRLLARRPPDAR